LAQRDSPPSEKRGGPRVWEWKVAKRIPDWSGPRKGGPPGVWIRLGRAGQKRGSSDFICLDLGEVGPGYLARSWSRSRTLPKPQLA